MTAFLRNVRKSVPAGWGSWSDWTSRWERANDLATCISLVHYGMRTEVDTPEEEAERRRT
jgi:hypothetical protein